MCVGGGGEEEEEKGGRQWKLLKGEHVLLTV